MSVVLVVIHSICISSQGFANMIVYISSPALQEIMFPDFWKSRRSHQLNVLIDDQVDIGDEVVTTSYDDEEEFLAYYNVGDVVKELGQHYT